MRRRHENHVRDVDGVTVGIVAADGRDARLQHAGEFKQCGIPFIVDPGSTTSVTARLRLYAGSIFSRELGLNEGWLTIARISPVGTSRITIEQDEA